MSELGPDARDLVAQAKNQGPELLGPSAEQRARLREKLTPLWAAEAATPPVRSGLRWKLAAAIAIAGLGALGAIFLRQELSTALPRTAAGAVEAAAAENLSAAPSTGCDPTAPRGSDHACPQLAAADCDPNARRGSDRACPPLAAADCDPNAPNGSAQACSPRASGACDPNARRGSARACPQLDVAACDPNAPHGSAQACSPRASGTCDPNARRGSARACPPLDAAACDPKAPHGSALACAPRPASLPQTALASAPRKALARRAERASDADAVASAHRASAVEGAGLGADCRSVDDGAGPRAGCAPASEQAGEVGVPVHARRAQLQPVRAERLPLRVAEDRTPARGVDTQQDPAPPSIDGELELLGAAQAALQKQRPSRALTLLQEHAFRFPTGSLVEERMAMQALALCALQRRHAAATVLSNLEARGSTSQLLPRVRSQCGL